MSATIHQLERELAAKTRELEVEAALESVRATSMAMENSNELMEVANMMFQKVHGLGIPIWTCGFNIWEPGDDYCTGWMSTNGAIQPSFRIPIKGSPAFVHMYESRKKGEESFTEEIGGEALAAHYRFMFSLPDFEAIANAQLKDGFNLPTSQVHHVYNFKQGNLIFIAASPLPEYGNTFKRFTKVFEQTYTRFLDLQKAEAQAREAKIEAALEKVRSSSLAIYRSDELKEVVTVLFEQLKELHIPVTSAGITIFMDESKDLNIYVCGEHDNGLVISNYLLPYFDHPICNDFHAVKEKHLDFFVGNYSREEKNSFYEHVIEHTALKDLPENIKEMIFQSQEYSISMANVFHSMIAINNFEGKGLSENETDIIKRFARVFEQAYIRFLDLQKAESQAREAEIQLALERVRARTMAMHKSEELAETSQVLFHQLIELGDIPDRISICIVDETNGMVDFWITDQIGAQINNSFRAQLNERTVIAKQYKGWKDQKKSLVVDLMGEELKEWMQFVREEMGIHVENEFIKNRRVHTSVFFSHGWILVTTHEPQSDETINILQRFAAVFNLTYRRFLDLQKAEAQAREAQIELALERVRAKTMAIQKPAEFVDVISVIGEQFAHLGFDNEWVNFGANGLDISKGIDIWELIYMPGHYQSVQRVFIPYIDNPVFNKLIEQFERYNKNGSNFFTILLDKKDLGKWLHHLYRETIYKEMPDEVKALGYSKTGSASSYITLKDTWLEIGKFGTNHFTDEQNEIFKRFANAFGQAYTRFVDLQKAEAQAREAQIELALERVRARTMAMHYSSELADTANILFQQIKELGFEIWSCGFGIWRPEVDLEEAWMSTGDLFPIIIVPFREDPTHLSIYEASQRGESVFEVEVKGEVLTRHYDWLMSQPSFKIVFGQIENSGIILPTVQYKYAAFFKQGYLHLITTKPQPDIHKINQRFAKVFEQTYTRFLDLQKAEAQAREAQIEASLERVRARTMAMHKSEELAEVAVMLYKELLSLGVTQEFFECGYIEIDEANKIQRGWMTGPDGNLLEPFNLPLTGEPIFDSRYEAWKQQTPVFHQVVAGEQLKRHIEYAIPYFESKEAEEIARNQVPDSIVFYCGNFSHGYLSINCGFLLNAEAESLLARFTRVFEMTYLRFLDLKKAEAQVREAQIEAAMERVRSRSMAMYKSDEINEVITLVFDQLRSLNILMHGAMIYLFDDQGYDFNLWLQDSVYSFAEKLHFTFFDHPFFNSLVQAKNSKQPLITDLLSKEKKDEFFKFSFEHSDLRKISDERKKFVLDKPGYARSIAVSKHMAMAIDNFDAIEYSDEENNILLRFSNVFEQTYTRFLDLQKAEAQAREAQIEAALEKIRSRSLAMHHSDELREVITVFFEKLIELDALLGTVGIALFDHKSKDIFYWVGNSIQDPQLVAAPFDEAMMKEDNFISQSWHAVKEKIEMINVVYSKEQKDRYFEHLFAHNNLIQIPESAREVLRKMEKHTVCFIPQHHSALFVDSWYGKQYSEDQISILRRAGKVFEQAYVRFLDLQKAEAQAREAKIEAALERVRSRSMGMQKSEDLREIIQVIYEQFIQLGVKIDSAGFAMDYMESDDFNFWFADAYSTFPTKVHVPYFDHPQFIRFKEAKEKGLDFYTSNLTFEEKNKFFDHVLKDAPPIPQEIREVFYGAPGYISSHVVLKNIVLYILNYTDIPFSDAENATLMRFGKVFEQAYIRFNDLKQAEAQALEAVKRASVDRVRAEIASMRTTSDLERITPLIWNELSTLGVPFFRCGVFIMDEEKQEVQSYLSTPEGNAIAAFRQPYNTPGEISEMVACWHKNELYKQHWNEEKFIEFTQNLVDQHAITSGEKYLTENRPTDLYLHFVPFLQGMLYAGSTNPLTENELQLVQNLADAFSTAYARYEDFNRLEAAKEVVDKTLTDLKQTQAKLVQSEKMASLGELTAGIAHEIQNPLNFVNNFSELNKELLAELNREIEEGNFEEVKMIALDVTGNEEKISHHGRRAEAIVKGMLQHSRSGVSEKEATDINKITDEYFRLAYHGFRGKDKSFNAILDTGYDENLPKADVVPQDIGRVLLNIFNNAFYAMNERRKDSTKADNTEVSSAYEPRVLVTTKKSGNEVVITVTDNGKGIPDNIITKIFQPFFTTKPTGQGTGLGLSLAYDIITRGHGGELKVNSVPGEGTEFIISLPLTE